MKANVVKHIRDVALAAAIVTVPVVANAQGTPATGANGTTAHQSTTAQPNTTSTGGMTGTATGGYGDPNATTASPAMGTGAANGTTPMESGGDVEDDNGGGSKAGWLGLLGLIGLAGLRNRGGRTTTSDTTATGRSI